MAWPLGHKAVEQSVFQAFNPRSNALLGYAVPDDACGTLSHCEMCRVRGLVSDARNGVLVVFRCRQAFILTMTDHHRLAAAATKAPHSTVCSTSQLELGERPGLSN